jgi:Rad3-related DNA helicase
MSNKLKADMNFLEYPTNVVDFKSKDNKIYELKISDDKYYKLVSRADDRLPSSKDKIIFYYFLKELKNNGFKNNTVIISRYKTAKEIWNNTSTNRYKRIETALSRYKGVTAEFHGCFFSDRTPRVPA